MKRLSRHKAILARFSEIHPNAVSVQIQIGHNASGYFYDFKGAI